MSSSTLRLGTRGSRLAMAQANAVSAALMRQVPGLDVQIVTIKTSGDQGDREVLGAFVKEIQLALLANEIDVALHCLKDLPTTPVPGLALSAYLEREDPRDALISRGPRLADLPSNSVVGTGSLRRTSQIAHDRPDLRFKPLVGNVDTRMRRLMDGDYDAIILAVAGLRRLGVLDHWSDSPYAALTVHPVEADSIVPAPGQAVLVLETRAGDRTSIEAVAPFHHPATALSSRAERAFLAAFGGGCSVPVGALAEARGEQLRLRGCVTSPDGSTQHADFAEGPASEPETLGRALARRLGEAGAFEIVQRVIAERDSEAPNVG